MRVMVVTFLLWLAGCAAEQKVPIMAECCSRFQSRDLCDRHQRAYVLPGGCSRQSQASAMAELARAVEVRVKTDLVLRSEGTVASRPGWMKQQALGAMWC